MFLHADNIANSQHNDMRILSPQRRVRLHGATTNYLTIAEATAAPQLINPNQRREIQYILLDIDDLPRWCLFYLSKCSRPGNKPTGFVVRRLCSQNCTTQQASTTSILLEYRSLTTKLNLLYESRHCMPDIHPSMGTLRMPKRSRPSSF